MGFWQTAFATAAGGLVTIVGIVVSNVMQARAQRKERALLREDLRSDAQRGWVLELQEVLMAEIAEAIEHQGHRLDRDEEAGDAYEPEVVQFELDRRRARWTRTLMLSSRVRDPELRHLSHEVVDRVERFYRSAHSRELDEHLMSAVSLNDQFNQRCGVVLDAL